MNPNESIPTTEVQSSFDPTEEVLTSADSTLIACSDALINNPDGQIQQGIRDGFVKLGENFEIIIHNADQYDASSGLLTGAVSIVYIHAPRTDESIAMQPVLVFGFDNGALETMELHQNINDPNVAVYRLVTDPSGQLIPDYENPESKEYKPQLEGAFSADVYDELADMAFQSALEATYCALTALESQKTNPVESETDRPLDYVSAHSFGVKIHDILVRPNVPATEAAQDYIQSELSQGKRIAIYKIDGKQISFEEDIASGLRTMSVRTTDRNFVLGLIRVTKQRYSIDAETLETSYGEDVAITDKKGQQSRPKLSAKTVALNTALEESFGFTTFTQARLAEALDMYTRCKQDPSAQVL